MNIILAVTGSVAASVYLPLYQKLCPLGVVKVVVTDSAKPFIEKNWVFGILTDEDEWTFDKKDLYNPRKTYEKGDKVLHIELRKWADAMVIAPCSANTLAKLANGLSDNLVTSIARAWDFSKPIFVAPAMNTLMWEHPITAEHLKNLNKFGYEVIPPVEKVLACGDCGVGAMADIDTIVKAVLARRWAFPLLECAGIPIGTHLGAFNAKRKTDFHTGVDLYCQEGDPVFTVEEGIVVAIEENFTGPNATQGQHYLHTQAVLVEGKSGVVNYGEVIPIVKVGEHVHKGQLVGNVTPVIPIGRERPDIVGHSRSMLHFELYKHGTRESVHYDLNAPYPKGLLNPTTLLRSSVGAPKTVWPETFVKKD